MFVSQAEPTPQEAWARKGQERAARLRAAEDDMTRLQAEINAAQARQVELVAQHIVADDGWGNWTGVRSAVGWLTWKLGYTPATARAVVTAARSLQACPHIKDSFAKGELSLAQVSVLLDICEDATEAQLVELAKNLSGAQLARFAGHYRSALRVEHDTAHSERFLHTSHRDDGSWVINGRLSSDKGAIIDQALRMAIDASRADGAGLDDGAADPFAAERADALVDVAESVLAKGLGSRQPSDRYLVNLDIDIATVISTEGVAKLRDGGIISARTAELLMCNSSIVDILTKDGEPLDVGRKRRSPTVAMRRALEARDRCCDFPGCTRTLDLHAHHNDDWGWGGHTKVRKMKLWCPYHHRCYHSGGFTVSGAWPQLVYRDRDGKIIERPRLEASGEGLAPLVDELAVTIDADTCTPGWGGEPGDLRYVADVYLASRPLDIARNEATLGTDPDPPGPSP